MVSEADDRFAPSRAAFHIHGEDADRTHHEALACGAADIHAPRLMDYGDRQGGVTDPSGDIRWIATRVTHESYDWAVPSPHAARRPQPPVVATGAAQ